MPNLKTNTNLKPYPNSLVRSDFPITYMWITALQRQPQAIKIEALRDNPGEATLLEKLDIESPYVLKAVADRKVVNELTSFFLHLVIVPSQIMHI